VKEIYSSYLSGRSPDRIALSIQERNIPSTRGGKFTYSLVWNILRCENYTEDSLLPKIYCEDFLSEKDGRTTEKPRATGRKVHTL